MSELAETPPVAASEEQARDLRMQCLRLALDFKDIDIVEQAKRFADFVLGPQPSPEPAAKKKRRKGAGMSAAARKAAGDRLRQMHADRRAAKGPQ